MDYEEMLRETAKELGVPASRLGLFSQWLYKADGEAHLVWFATFSGMKEGLGESPKQACQALIEADSAGRLLL